MSAYSLVSPSASYLANVIVKSGRNEVQFYTLDAGQPTSSAVKRHELQTSEAIICACWISGAGKKRSNKRKAGDQAVNGSSQPVPLLVVAMASQEVWVFSPVSDHVTKINSDSKVVSLTSSSKNGHFWGLDETSHMLEFSAVEGKVLGKMQVSIRSAKTMSFTSILHTPLRFRKSGAEETLLLAGHDLFVIDGTKTKKNVHAKVKIGQADIVSMTLASESKILVQTKNGVWCVDLVSHEVPPVSVGSALQVTALRSLEAYNVAYTDNGAELFHMTDEALEQATQEGGSVQRVACISPASRSVRFENLFAGPSGVFAVYYHGLQPRFVKVSETAEFTGDYEITTETPEASEPNGVHEKPSSNADFSFRAEVKEIRNLQPSDLFESLSAKLLHGDAAAVLELCSSNDDENSIKETVRLFSKSEKCSQLVVTLFDIISSKVALDPTLKSSLSIWLKWVLLTHGGYISKQPSVAPQLKALQKSLDEGMALLPKLLGLQGRLQLLKAQTEYRNSLSVADETADQEEREFEAVNDTLNNTTMMEESVVYGDAEEPAALEFVDGEAAGDVE